MNWVWNKRQKIGVKMENLKQEKEKDLFEIVLLYCKLGESDDPIILVGTHVNASATTWG